MAATTSEVTRHVKVYHERDYSFYSLLQYLNRGNGGDSSGGDIGATRAWINENINESLSTAIMQVGDNFPDIPVAPNAAWCSVATVPLTAYSVCHRPPPMGLVKFDMLEMENIGVIDKTILEGIAMWPFPCTILTLALLAPTFTNLGPYKDLSGENPSPGQADCTVVGYAMFIKGMNEELDRVKLININRWGAIAEGYDDRTGKGWDGNDLYGVP